MTTSNPPVDNRMKPSPLMIRTLSAFVFLVVVLAGVYAGLYGVYALVILLGGLARWAVLGLSDGIDSRARAWLLFPLAASFSFRPTALKQTVGHFVLLLALVRSLPV